MPFKRRTLPADNDQVNFRITPVRPPAELRKEALAASPPRESRDLKQPDLVELRALDPTIKYDIRYATSNNFMGTPFYSSAHAFMQRPAAEAVARASAELRKLGLRAADSRCLSAVVRDEDVLGRHAARQAHLRRRPVAGLAAQPRLRGRPHAVRPEDGRADPHDRRLRRDVGSLVSAYPGGTSLQRWHRDLLRHAMEAQGFNVYEAEWWHFDYRDWRSYPIGNLTFEQLAKAGAASSQP